MTPPLRTVEERKRTLRTPEERQGTAKRMRNDVQPKDYSSKILKNQLIKMTREITNMKKDRKKIENELDALKVKYHALSQDTLSIDAKEVGSSAVNIEEALEAEAIVTVDILMPMHEQAEGYEETLTIHDEEMLEQSSVVSIEEALEAEAIVTDDTLIPILEQAEGYEEILTIHDEEVLERSSAVNIEEAIVSNNILESIPIREGIFIGWDNLLKDKNSYLTMENFYLNINIKEENRFVKACISRTFEESFIQNIHFDSHSEFNNSNILLCLISSLQKKFNNLDYDDIQARSKIVAGFRRFRNAEIKRKARL